ncbi:hypothetical protein LTR97_005077 [Elasticomyces elasticus]|uniref:LYR motif-containing protein Cup1-like N-terminal domain-containing protein n=1 Tax=Elasticomyces elasticus TaxID=574655 RepID=A0AAN8A2N5_9PEZI|nr:hypothetical protein LTR97_005077 [Elasticomyces elasticus]
MQRRGWSAVRTGWRCSRYSTEARTTSFEHGVKTTQPRPQATYKTPLHHERDISARHLLRSLLRESTYLPDSHARSWTHQHILSRFRKYTFKVWQHRDDPAYETHIRERLGDGRHGLGLLRRANEGERKPLLKVLLMAYGRVGKRRWELMVPLMPVKYTSSELKAALEANVEAVADSETDKTLPNTQPNPPRQNPTGAPQVPLNHSPAYVPAFTPQLRALLEAQLRTPPPHLTRPSLRRLAPKIDALNSWLRPLHPSRVKNQTKEWYADTLSKVHAPLPLHEWERLRDLASGARTEKMRPRRMSARGLATGVVGGPLEMVVMYGKVGERKAFGNREGHAITKRFMRRLWGQVFTQCPLMEWSGDTARWKVSWGQQALGVGHGVQQHAPAVERKEAATTG